MADRDDAKTFLRNLMDDPAATMANRIRAAEAILRSEAGERPIAPGDALHAMSEAELLERARGEGGGPPREGPKAPGLSRVPSQADGEQPIGGGTSAPVGASLEAHPLAGPDHLASREPPHPFRKRGPKEDPDPFAALLQNRKRGEPLMVDSNSSHIASEQQIGDDPPPWM